MKSTRASVQPSERHSVALDQSAEGVRCSKLALLTANPSSSRFILLPPLCTHKMSQCQECLPSSSRVEVVGGLSGADYTLGGSTTPYNWLLA